MWPRTYAIGHAADDLLNGYVEQGCPVKYGNEWQREQISMALEQGPYTSARQPTVCAVLHKETDPNLKNRCVTKIRWWEKEKEMGVVVVKNNTPPKLKNLM